ncbi:MULTISPECIES: phage replisome organizer N-terminal domain-containing protein [Anaerococcus]|uniref:phage replisome organizer N-terminal domain-containing protein n=1 Tax=Anaerococcus TaxID=165779 RepID=UPI00242FBD13|nr:MULTISPECIES: phage replisome organizer N-terminal domain-containing protein [Anaerococcus]MDD7767057.1 phage replisome organizer N-terminal domain-containing protein [Anaerococcus vaginalis]MDY6127026.1 phage replisome organizer N-terminal domain-containing protein [Anaerococcus sp.]
MAGISWIKLSVNIFDDEKIKLIKSMPEGDAIILIWIQLLCLAGKTNDNGAVYIGQHMNYTDEMISTICNQPLNTVRIALKAFEEFEMINLGEDGLISISNWEKHQNIEGMERVKTGNAERQQLYYWRKKLVSIGLDPYQDGFTQDIEELKRIYESKNLTLGLTSSHRPDIDKNKNRIDKNKNRLEIDNNNISKNFNDEEKITVDYYYRLVKNNTSKNDIDLVVNAINQYGWKKIFYTLWYLKNEQKANITSFKYVDKVLSSQKELDMGVVDFVVNREIRNIKCLG